MLKSRNAFPPNGWQFFQPETNWQPTPYIGFGPTVDEIITHRRANPRFNLATDRTVVENELEAYTVARLRTMPGSEQWLTSSAPTEPPPNFSFRPRQRSLRAVDAAGAGRPADTVKKVKAGISVIKDWLGDGLKPVSQEIADSRASICARCPQNKPAIGTQVLTGVIADGLHLLMEARNDMGLHTAHDQMLHTCQVCDCKLALKVFTPLDHVRRHTSQEVFDALDPSCWIRHENSA